MGKFVKVERIGARVLNLWSLMELNEDLALVLD